MINYDRNTASRIITVQRLRNRKRLPFITNKIPKGLTHSTECLVINLNSSHTNFKNVSNSYMDALQIYFNSSFRKSNNGLQFAPDGTLYKQKKDLEPTSDRKFYKNKVNVMRNESKSVFMNKDHIGIQTETKNAKSIHTKTKQTNCSYEMNCDNWKYLRAYLLSNYEKMGISINKRNNITSFPADDYFPYLSYFKHKRNKSTETYICGADIKRLGGETKISNQRPAIKNVEDSFRLTGDLNKKQICMPQSELNTNNKNWINSTTAQMLTEKYKSLYDMVDVQRYRVRTPKSKNLSPFDDFVAEQREKKKQITPFKENKKKIVPYKLRQITKKIAPEQKPKLYIGIANFPLSIYERSIS